MFFHKEKYFLFYHSGPFRFFLRWKFHGFHSFPRKFAEMPKPPQILHGQDSAKQDPVVPSEAEVIKNADEAADAADNK